MMGGGHEWLNKAQQCALLVHGETAGQAVLDQLQGGLLVLDGEGTEHGQTEKVVRVRGGSGALEQDQRGLVRRVFFDQVKGCPHRLGKVAQNGCIRAVDRAMLAHKGLTVVICPERANFTGFNGN